VGDVPNYLKLQEADSRKDRPADDLTLEKPFTIFTRGYGTTAILIQTPWIFRAAPPWQLSYLDRLLDNGVLALPMQREAHTAIGSWAPFFYNDRQRTFFVLPCLRKAKEERPPGLAFSYYPDIKHEARQWVTYFEGVFSAWVNGLNLAALTPAQ